MPCDELPQIEIPGDSGCRCNMADGDSPFLVRGAVYHPHVLGRHEVNLVLDSWILAHTPFKYFTDRLTEQSRRKPALTGRDAKFLAPRGRSGPDERADRIQLRVTERDAKKRTD